VQTIEAKVQIGDDRRLSMQLPTNVSVGEYEVVLVLNQPPRMTETVEIAETVEMAEMVELTALQKIQFLLKQSIQPGQSLADELIQERREAAHNE
jgi:hypothetical protein